MLCTHNRLRWSGASASISMFRCTMKVRHCDDSSLMLSAMISCRAETRKKIVRLLMIYDDELRNPTGSRGTALRRIANYDYADRLAENNTEAAIAHLVPQVCSSSSCKGVPDVLTECLKDSS